MIFHRAPKLYDRVEKNAAADRSATEAVLVYSATFYRRASSSSVSSESYYSNSVYNV